MAKKPVARKQPFVIQPLNWVAPQKGDDESSKDQQPEKPTPAQPQQD
ncbi:hypothetical protein GSY71_03570 [Pusillimonas sp. TS35]|nr:hypothetical protein [Paracandidimonas lactea]MYN12231.1 hypothetical protein [Pusillimonas sp. TS35]